MSKDYDLYDLYVLKSYGIPIFAGCTGSDYCKGHHKQHELHVGFFSAIYSFSKESFVDTTIHSIIFDKIQINFEIDEETNIIIIFEHPCFVETDLIRNYLTKAMNIFLENYIEQLTDGVIRNDLFKQYQQDLQRIGVLPNRKLHDTSEMQKKLRDLLLQQFPVLKKEK